MATSSNTTWLKGFSGNPDGEARGEGASGAGDSLAELIGAIGGERVVYPPGGDDALPMIRREALARTLWTRGVIDGDMTAIKLLVELLQGKGAEGHADGDALLNADLLAASESALRAWVAEQAVADKMAAGQGEEVSGNDGADERA